MQDRFKSKKETKVIISICKPFFGVNCQMQIFNTSNNEKAREYLKQYIAQYGVPKKIRTDQNTLFLSEAFTEFCEHFGMKHITCPHRDHWGNGKNVRLVRTINERLRTNMQIILSEVKSGLSEILYSLGKSEKDGKRRLKGFWVRNKTRWNPT